MTFVMNIYTKTDNQQDIRSKAANDNILSVCPNSDTGCTYVGGDGIQQAVDAAIDGSIISLKAGTYTRRTSTPIEGEKFDQCFVHTRGKNITIKGEGFGSIIFSENDEIGTGIKGLSRTIICIQGGNVTLDNVHLKQSLRHAINISNAQAIVKNVWTDDIDNIPVMVRLNSRVAFVNNFINGPMNIDDGSRVVVINNTFCGGGINLNLCREKSPATTIVNNIFSLTNGGVYSVSVYGAYGGHCEGQPEKIAANKIRNNLIWRNKDRTGCDGNEICDFPGKVEADPLYESFPSECAYGDVGIVGWAHNYHLKEGSPGKGAGDPSIASEVGMYGGPCADANSSGCNSFITAQLALLDPPATPTLPVPTINLSIPSPSNSYPTNYIPPTLSQNPQPYISDQPPISYYLPPTIPNNNPSNNITQKPNIIIDNPTTVASPTVIPTITPTKTPLINIKQTVNNSRIAINKFITSLIQLTKVILP